MPDSESLATIGWREWVALPDLGVAAVKAKIDTGAKTSSLHALEIEEFRRRGALWVRFRMQPYQQQSQTIIEAEALLTEYRHVRSSNGQLDHRPVIRTRITLLGQTWPIELSLSDRHEMGFRMLLGREALRERFWVDPGASFRGGIGPQTAHDRHLQTLRGRRLHKERDE